MTIRSRCLVLLHAVLVIALAVACDGEQGTTDSSASDANDAFGGGDSDHESSNDATLDHQPGDAAEFFPPPPGDFARYEVSGASEFGNQWLLDISTDAMTFENENYTVLSFGDASGDLGTAVTVWADMVDPMEVGVRQIEFHQDSALHDVEWWPLGPLDSDLRITFTEPLAMDFSGQAGGLVSTSGEGEIVWNDGVPVDGGFMSTIIVLGRDVTVEVPYGTVDRVVKVAIELTRTDLVGDASFGGTFDMHSDLGMIAAGLDSGIETIALASLAAH